MIPLLVCKKKCKNKNVLAFGILYCFTYFSLYFLLYQCYKYTTLSDKSIGVYHARDNLNALERTNLPMLPG